MIPCKVQSGYVGVSINSYTNCVLLQTSSDNDKTQTRVSLTKEEAKGFIKLIEENLKRLEEQEKFNEHLEKSSEVVSKYPLWKQNILGTVQNLNETLPKEELAKLWAETIYEADRPRTWKEWFVWTFYGKYRIFRRNK